MDLLDLSMLGHTAGLAGRVGKSVLSGSNLDNAYRSDIAGRMLNQAAYRGQLPTTEAIKSSFQEKGISPQEATTTYHLKDLSLPGSRSITEAEKLGIPKGLRSNPKALEDPYYWGYEQ